jgi:hypothetical protein
MAALTRGRTTKHKYLQRTQAYPVAAEAVIFTGALVALNAAGFLVAASDAAGIVVVGIALKDADNTGGTNGALSCGVYKGVVALNNAGASSVDAADRGRAVYVADDNTVVKAAGVTNNIEAGILDEIDDDGQCWVAVGMFNF